MAGNGLQYVLLFVVFVYLTRILQPRDFGLMAMLSIGLDLGLRIARWGQIELLQQPRNRTDSARNHAFRLSLGIACVPSLMFGIAAWPLGQYFGSTELTIMAYLCAPVILIAAAGSTAEAILRNEFRFETIAYRNTVCTLIAGAIATLLAIRGFGAVALAAQQLIQATLGAIWVWLATDWRPSVARRSWYDPEAARHGASIMIGSLLPQLIPRSFDLFVALLLGPIALGTMRVANRFNDFLGQLVVIPLAGVASTQFATLAGEPSAMRWSYLQLTQASAAMICPLIIGVGLVAPEAVPLLFGPKWGSSIPIVQILSLLALATPISLYFAPAMIAIGKRSVVVRQSILDVIIGLAVATVAACISLKAVAVAAVARCVFTSLCNAADLQRHLKLALGDLARHLLPPYAATLVMTASVTATRMALAGHDSPFATLMILSLVGAASYVATIIVGAHLRFWPSYTDALARLLPQVLKAN